MTKTINVYIVYDLGNWAINSLKNFALKNCLLGATNIVKNNDRVNVYSGYGIAFYGGGSQSFGKVMLKFLVLKIVIISY